MNHIFYTKTQDFKIFGFTIFTHSTVYNETEHETDFDIVVKADYFDKEFKINGKDQ